eukprot:GFUD01030955.1.p1 GENE.GFUD01030955.1~~GFUD01030955.1.p1  ORF type:complete len:198 (-),score=42.88 GFUD01030955.1:62-655(-)
MTQLPPHPIPILSTLFLIISLTSAHPFMFPDEYQNSLSTRSSRQSSCVTLERCDTLMRMWNSRHVMMNALEALGALERAQCGFLGSSDTPLFRCPEEPLTGIRRLVVGDGEISPLDCAGTVKLFTDDDAEPAEVATESNNQLKVEADRVVVTGNCCWRLYARKLFRGRSLGVRPGAAHAGIGTIKSIEKLEECPTEL